MRVLVCQLNPKIGEIGRNTDKILQSIENGRKKGADIILFPEMMICGYPPEDLVLHQTFIDSIEEHLKKIIHASHGLFVVVGLVRQNPTSVEKNLFNSAAIIHDGKLLGFQDKRLLPTYDVFDERRYFEPGVSSSVWEYKGKKIGITICEDIWQHAGYVDYTDYSVDPILDLKKQGIDLLLNLSASPYHYKKPPIRVEICSRSAKTLASPMIMCCQVGGNDEIIFDGYSIFVNEQGELCQLAKGFMEDEMLIDLKTKKTPLQINENPIEDLYKALVLGLKDYCAKTGFSKACLGLSGGIDSALVACIAKEALGSENVLCLAMPSRYSSPESLEDAQILADNLSLTLEVVPIEGPFESYLQLVEPYFSNRSYDLTEENMQARIRGMILMAFSNKLGPIVLSTGNKSEYAMGYCTLYGDMCGGLGVIADVMKTRVYELATFINQKKEIIPIRTIQKAPSAELRPNQKDSDTLPDYKIVDEVIEGYVENFLSSHQISKKYGIDKTIVEKLIAKIHCAEYKRRQAAPVLRVSKKSFGKGRRYPIVQGWN